MTIEEAIQVARTHVSRHPKFKVPGGLTVEVTDVVSASHSSFLGRTDDIWIVAFGLDWGMPIRPNIMSVTVDGKSGIATYVPIL